MTRVDEWVDRAVRHHSAGEKPLGERKRRTRKRGERRRDTCQTLPDTAGNRPDTLQRQIESEAKTGRNGRSTRGPEPTPQQPRRDEKTKQTEETCSTALSQDSRQTAVTCLLVAHCPSHPIIKDKKKQRSAMDRGLLDPYPRLRDTLASEKQTDYTLSRIF